MQNKPSRAGILKRIDFFLGLLYRTQRNVNTFMNFPNIFEVVKSSILGQTFRAFNWHLDSRELFL